ncbi:MAG: AraC family transcriptional regulator [Planctomyces sp.]|jgi:PAS domain S-box-containing protein|nr:AraC family transcriptional regulator [Planctomyces sp.]
MSKTPRIANTRSEILRLVPGLSAAETLFDALNDVLFCVKDRERRYVAANTAFVRAAGLRTLAELLGRRADGLFPPALAAGYEQQDDAVLSTGNPVHNRLEMVTRNDGAIGWFMSQKVPVHDMTGRIVALAGISRDLSTPAEQGKALDPFALALGTLATDFAGPVRVMKLAESSGLSVSQFERKVREFTGLSPRQLLTKARIEAAATALRETETPLKDLAVDCGFYDQASFSRQFREATGTTPGEYRRTFHERRT